MKSLSLLMQSLALNLHVLNKVTAVSATLTIIDDCSKKSDDTLDSVGYNRKQQQ